MGYTDFVFPHIPLVSYQPSTCEQLDLSVGLSPHVGCMAPLVSSLYPLGLYRCQFLCYFLLLFLSPLPPRILPAIDLRAIGPQCGTLTTCGLHGPLSLLALSSGSLSLSIPLLLPPATPLYTFSTNPPSHRPVSNWTSVSSLYPLGLYRCQFLCYFLLLLLSILSPRILPAVDLHPSPTLEPG